MRIAITLLAALVVVPAVASAQVTHDVSALSDAEIASRIAFLEQRLDAGETWAKYWQWGWTGGYATGIVIGTAQAATTHSDKNRVNYITTAVKGVIGTTRLVFWPHPGRNGADEIDAANFGNTRADQERRLLLGEQILQKVADKATHRTNWKSHAANVGLNLAGAAFILGFGHATDAAESFGIGVAVGTANILSAPKRGIQDLEDYETRFGMKTGKRFNWSVTPTVGGAALHVTF